MIGLDLCSIARVEATLAEHGERFMARVLTPAERAAMPSPTPAKLARRWAIKEAVAKALGTGIGEQISFQDIEVSHTNAGAPTVRVRRHESTIFDVSVSDDAGLAMAIVMIRR